MFPRDHDAAILHLRAEATAPAAARRFVDAVLGDDLGAERQADTRLLVSELVTNALRHTGTEIELCLVRHGDTVEVGVRDYGGGHPVKKAQAGEDGGWGLRLLDLITSRWGVETERPGKTVWFHLRLG